LLAAGEIAADCAPVLPVAACAFDPIASVRLDELSDVPCDATVKPLDVIVDGVRPDVDATTISSRSVFAVVGDTAATLRVDADAADVHAVPAALTTPLVAAPVMRRMIPAARDEPGDVPPDGVPFVNVYVVAVSALAVGTYFQNARDPMPVVSFGPNAVHDASGAVMTPFALRNAATATM
jgi:hypothetical protein